jgi:3-oxoacyl-[acyl-carrier protein] reductase
MDKKPLAGKLALVTGGSSGIGAACVRLLAAEGASVVIGYNQGRDRAEALLAELPGRGHMTLKFSLEDPASHAACAQYIEDKAGRADILINSAGFTRRIPHTDLDTLSPELFNSFLTANVGGTYAITRAMMPLLKASGDGLVVNVSSVSAFTGSGSNMAYCAAKAGLDTLTMSLARAFGPLVRFLCVSPASVDTDFVAGRSRSEMEKKAMQLPLGRMVTPEDVALAVVACATHLKTATGSRIVIDGGHHL